MRQVKKVFDIFGIIAGVVLFAIAMLIFVDTLIRFFIGTSIQGVYEVSEVGFLITIFIALAITQYRQKNIRIEILKNNLKKGEIYYLLEILNTSMVFIFFVIIFGTSLVEWSNAYYGQLVRSGVINIPIVIHMSFIVLGSALVCISLVFTIMMNFNDFFSKQFDSESNEREPGVK